jgi:DNA-binding NtrC family response regulator
MTVDLIKRMNDKHPLNILTDIVEDQAYYRELLFELLDLHGLKNRREFSMPKEYEEELEKQPNLIPHLALLDFRYDGTEITGNDLTEILIAKSKRRKLKTKVFMITGYEFLPDIKAFYELGGTAWLNKDDKNFNDVFKSKILKVVPEILEAMEELALLEEIDED